MRATFILLLAFVSVAINCGAQVAKRYPVGKSGCQVWMFCNPGSFELSMSPDSSSVYTGECKDGSVTYDVICVKMKEKIDSLDDAEAVLIQYLDYLRTSFEVTDASGYGKGHRIKGMEKTSRGVIDYWKDKDGMNIKVKGWTNGKYISVHLVISPEKINETKANIFLDGIVFPGAVKKK